jgi:hypothetical protein
MLTVALARRLREAGLKWQPAPGDRFVIPDRGMDDELFILSNMTIEVHDFPDGRVIGFNGTVEWALDSIEQQETLWLPHEEQLRRLLGGTFQRLEKHGDRSRVVVEISGRETTIEADEADEAYARALLFLITGEHAPADESMPARRS